MKGMNKVGSINGFLNKTFWILPPFYFFTLSFNQSEVLAKKILPSQKHKTNSENFWFCSKIFVSGKETVDSQYNAQHIFQKATIFSFSFNNSLNNSISLIIANLMGFLHRKILQGDA